MTMTTARRISNRAKISLGCFIVLAGSGMMPIAIYVNLTPNLRLLAIGIAAFCYLVGGVLAGYGWGRYHRNPPNSVRKHRSRQRSKKRAGGKR